MRVIDLHFWPTPNGFKITIALEELGLPYRIVPVDIGRGAQFTPEFLAISPNNRMPAIVDHEPLGGGAPLAIFESGAILEYLADKTGKLLSKEPRPRYDALQWLAWQIAGLGPMAGQYNHFHNYAPEKLPYAIARYTDEVHRLYGVLDRRLADRAFLAGDYGIADIASFPWVASLEKRQAGKPATEPNGGFTPGGLGAEFPHLARWFDAVAARPAVIKGHAAGRDVSRSVTVDDEAKKILFGQRARK